MKYLFKYKATIERYYNHNKKVKGLVQVEAEGVPEAEIKIREWLCNEHGVTSDMLCILKIKVVPSI